MIQKYNIRFKNSLIINISVTSTMKVYKYYKKIKSLGLKFYEQIVQQIHDQENRIMIKYYILILIN